VSWKTNIPLIYSLFFFDENDLTNRISPTMKRAELRVSQIQYRNHKPP